MPRSARASGRPGYLRACRGAGRDVRYAVRLLRVLRWVQEVLRSAARGRQVVFERHSAAWRSAARTDLVRCCSAPVRVAASRHARRVRSAGRSARAEPRRDAAVAVVEVRRQAASAARVRRGDEPAAEARHAMARAVAQGEPQVPAVPQVDAEVPPWASEAAQRETVRPLVLREVRLSLAHRAAEPSAASCDLETCADRERPVPSKTMTMVRHEPIAKWKTRRSRAVSVSVYSYPPFEVGSVSTVH